VASDPNIEVDKTIPRYSRHKEAVTSLIYKLRDSSTGDLKDSVLKAVEMVIKVTQKSKTIQSDLQKTLWNLYRSRRYGSVNLQREEVL